MQQLQRKRLASNFVSRPKIWDTTLRDGQQTPGVRFSKEEKLLVSRGLNDYGVDVIEAGAACKGKDERAAISAVCDALGPAKVASFARIVKSDVDAVADSGAGIVALVLPASDLHVANKLKTDRRGALHAILESVDYALGKGLGVELLAEDATRANPDFLAHVALEAQKHGVDGFCVCDTVGMLDPLGTHALFRFLSRGGVKNLSFHGHDDMGMAAANTFAALHAGAVGFQATVNGLGERCGNCPLEQVVLSLYALAGMRIAALEQTIKLSELVAALSNFHPANSQPLVGAHAFMHKAGIHAAGMAADCRMYEGYDPALFGAKRSFLLSSESGRKGVAFKLKQLGLELKDAKVPLLMEKVREMEEAGHVISDADVIMLVEIVKESGMHEKLKLVHRRYWRDNDSSAMAEVGLKLNGDPELKTGRAGGDGSVDALLSAINNALGGDVAKLLFYHVDDIRGGSDAPVRVSVVVEVGGKVISSSASNQDIVYASGAAYVKGINVLL